MGVTIHFEGRLKNKRSLASVLSAATEFSQAHDWPLQRVRDEQDWDCVGPITGLEIQPHQDSEPFRLEFDPDRFLKNSELKTRAKTSSRAT